MCRPSGETFIRVGTELGSKVATYRINFRLLAREAQERGKRIEIVSADSSARALASSAGLAVHPSVAAYEGHQSGVGGDITGAAAAGSLGTSGGGNGTGTKTADEQGSAAVA